jgi:hypothetical protein
MSSDLILFLVFALIYTAAWWLVMRGSGAFVHTHVGEDERGRPRRSGRASARPNKVSRPEAETEPDETERTIPLAKPAPVPIKTTPGAIPSAWSLPESTTTRTTPPAAAQPLATPPPEPAPPEATASPGLATDDPVAEPADSATADTAPAQGSIDAPEPANPPTATSSAPEPGSVTTALHEPMTSPNEAMNSNPIDFPNWMEETMNSRSKSEAPRAAKPSEHVEPRAAIPAPIAARPASDATAEPASSATGSMGEALSGLSRIEKERMQVMAQLDGWARAWAEVEKRSAVCVDDLSRQVQSLAQEHAQCDGRRRELEQRSKEAAAQSAAEIQSLRTKVSECEPFVKQAKELGARCSALGEELSTTRGALDEQKRACGALEERCKSTTGELDKLKDHLARSQEATKEATARELDWQRRYHEDTGKLMQQLTSKSQECERWIGENQKQKTEIDRQTRDLRSKDEIVQTMSQRCADLDQRSTTLQGTLEEKEATIVDLARQIAELQKELETRRAAEEEQASMLLAAQGVLSELQPKLRQLEKRLTKQ